MTCMHQLGESNVRHYLVRRVSRRYIPSSVQSLEWVASKGIVRYVVPGVVPSHVDGIELFISTQNSACLQRSTTVAGCRE